jgi:hypothetical protein
MVNQPAKPELPALPDPLVCQKTVIPAEAGIHADCPK